LERVSLSARIKRADALIRPDEEPPPETPVTPFLKRKRNLNEQPTMKISKKELYS
jgi:hypothetical protein